MRRYVEDHWTLVYRIAAAKAARESDLQFPAECLFTVEQAMDPEFRP